MDALELARWQFAITTVYHFLFVPLTIGLAFSVAGLQTAWHRTGDERYLRLTRFFGELFLINFAMGVVTMFGWFGHANGGFLGGYLYDMTNDYAAAYAIAALAGALNLLVVATLRWKLRGPGGARSAAV